MNRCLVIWCAPAQLWPRGCLSRWKRLPATPSAAAQGINWSHRWFKRTNGNSLPASGLPRRPSYIVRTNVRRCGQGDVTRTTCPEKLHRSNSASTSGVVLGITITGLRTAPEESASSNDGIVMSSGAMHALYASAFGGRAKALVFVLAGGKGVPIR